MKWSFSQHNTFRRCQRQWFYRYIYASSRANDEGRQEAYRLSKLVNIKAWRGKIVDAVLSDTVVPSIGRGRPADLETAREKAWDMFTEQKRRGLQPNLINGGDFWGFQEAESGVVLSQEKFDAAWHDIDVALHAFFRSAQLWDALTQASKCKTQCFISFSCPGANVIAMPDVICFYPDSSPLIIDWKVHSNPIGDYRTQLTTYALALTTCKPHKGWPALPPDLAPTDVTLIEAQLLTGTLRTHTVSEEEIEDLQEMIACSAAEILLARGGRAPKEMQAEDFPTAYSPGTCHYCPFRRLCWVTEQ